ncbi:phosphoesterase [Philodulcilactobacillus myokoensis]|uniref:Phosphoesterase n=1 Tax=Philodulcilactobacillus myokoensis TaxID=2929573 RepID=A0A9W6B1B0_9LACO|nr:bifunctional oligoribonuclease/PAP phosphatase NrnA [Philodulcilactobacillus myokoensis]GLB46680.1 phosphoesterase [Philodulcilactobacillus myokoensis]
MNVQQQIIKAIKKYNPIIIHRHKRPDPDAYGSQMGLASIIKTSFPNKEVYCVGKQYPGFDWLGRTDQIDDDKYKNALVITVDTANQPRVDDQRYKDGQMLIKIDHHPNDDPYGDLKWVVPEASSASEMIYDLYHMSADLKINDEAGRLLYAGIVGDTGRFKYPSTSAHTFEVAAQLAKLNFSTSDVNQIESEIDKPLARLSAYVYQNVTFLDSGAAYIVLDNDTLNQFKLGDDGTSAVVPLPGLIKSVKAWAIFVQQKDQTYRIRLRSKGPSINELAKNFGGGGHALASGATVKDQDGIKQVIKQLDQIANNYKGEIV